MAAKAPPPDAQKLGALLIRAQFALRLSQREFGPLLGSSQRTAERWAAGTATPTEAQCAKLAGLVHRDDAALAAAIAAAHGESLVSWGIVKPAAVAAAQSAPDVELVDLVVYAAADAMDISPRLIRPALHAAFARAKQLGLDVTTVEAALAPPAPRRAKR